MFSAPEPLNDRHDLTAFDCGEPVLDTWLRRRAFLNQVSGASKTYVVCDQKRVLGFYSLATGAVCIEEAVGSVKRNMPDPVPMMLLGRLAVDRKGQGQGVGRALLRDALLRTLQVAEIVGVRGVFVHALSDEAKRFYEKAGFRASLLQPMMLMVTLAEVRASLV